MVTALAMKLTLYGVVQKQVMGSGTQFLWLVVYLCTPLQNMKVTWDDDSQ
jgi:hypothetical protein